MNRKQTKQLATRLLHESIKTTHSRILTAGLLFVFAYLAVRLFKLLIFSLRGFSSGILALGVISLGLWFLWKDRRQLEKLQAGDEDRLLGYVLILGGAVLFPFCVTSEWSLALVCSVILTGVACSVWGAAFFQKHLLSTLLILGGILPNKSPIAKALWQAFTPPNSLERLMAWGGGWTLKAIGQQVKFANDIISLPGGSVRVDWGCNGFDMALNIAVAGLMIGLLFKQRRSHITLMIAIGIFLALVFNIPRIVLLAMSQAYWGKSAFEFWHGFWGGQIFSALLFTTYYYVVMAIINRKPLKPKT
ncbi:cyanoexosortase C [Kovacikia minuta CCNUW1]|uniref:cyanoexosortase C n=1 Tax=Kovacikia minuta TaxID=2931930 RepID=UPI001CCC5AB1|nr:cyanoexosortase C [Kovacikia minuta]UBF27350.1 cyanoexosortase C [Kovacikia minuta CCNUW1]